MSGYGENAGPKGGTWLRNRIVPPLEGEAAKRGQGTRERASGGGPVMKGSERREHPKVKTPGEERESIVETSSTGAYRGEAVPGSTTPTHADRKAKVTDTDKLGCKYRQPCGNEDCSGRGGTE